MGLPVSLHEILQKQKSLIDELEAQVREIESRDVSKENEVLKARMEKLTVAHDDAIESARGLKEKNARLTDALYAQTYNEKLKILDSSKRRQEIFFQSAQKEAENRLSRLERLARERIEKMRRTLETNHIDAAKEIFNKLNTLSAEVDEIAAAAQKAHAEKAFSDAEEAEFAALRNEQITQDQIVDLSKKNNIERFVGLSLLNGLGILLVIIGTITAGVFVQEYLTDEIRAVLIFVLGATMLAAGEFMNRKKPNVFSLGITAGGVAVLFVGVVISYFALEVLPMYPALGLTVVVTAAAFYLTTRYRSQTLLGFSFVGGYLPIFAITPAPEMVYGAMIYFIALNLLALLVSARFKWIIPTYIGLFFNIASTIYIVRLADAESLTAQIVVFAFVFFAFLIYTALPILSTFRAGDKFTSADVVLIGINTFVSCIVMIRVFYRFEWDDFTGLLAVAIAATYFAAGIAVRKNFDTSARTTNAMRDLFYLTGAVFVVLTVPFQFGADSLVLGWVLQGVAVAGYGVLKGNARFRRWGLVIFGLCVAAFLLGMVGDTLSPIFRYGSGRLVLNIDALNYFAVTFGGLAILGAYIYKARQARSGHRGRMSAATHSLEAGSSFPAHEKARQARSGHRGHMSAATHSLEAGSSFPAHEKVAFRAHHFIFKYVVLVNFWLYVMFVVDHYLLEMYRNLTNAPQLYAFFTATPQFYALFTAVAITFAIGFALPRIKFLTDKGVRIIGMCLLAFGVLWLFLMNFVRSDLDFIALAVVSAVCVVSVFAVYDFLRQFIVLSGLGVRVMPVILSAYTLVILTQYLMTRHDFSFNSMWLSFIYAAAALGCIIFGFVKRYISMRRTGLGLALFAVAKLFLIDLSWLESGWRILSYFVLGAVLIAISYVYQFFSKRLDAV
ncbi:MAG: DUF2339 domain-containing protein [Defluviitaleaceae bacterium]|nr:DUF2339 domain-containing protein [Defluviitaleaceae bacterium]